MKITKIKYAVVKLCVTFIALNSARATAEDDHGGEKKQEAEHGKEIDTLADLPEEKVKQLGIPILKAAGGPIDSYLIMFGKIDLHPEKALHLHSKYPGVVHEVYKSIGDEVRAGTVLARVENNVGVQTSDLVSTINGFVIEKKIAAGQSINEDIEAFTVADTSVVMATLTAYPRDMNRISVGQTVSLQSSKDNPAEIATISYISPLLDEKTRTGKVQFFLKNDKGLWRAGQFVIGTIHIGKRDVTVRLAKDLFHSSGSSSTKLYVKNGNQFVQRSVGIKAGDSSFVEITSGLSAGEEYLGLGLDNIEDIIKKKAVDADTKK